MKQKLSIKSTADPLCHLDTDALSSPRLREEASTQDRCRVIVLHKPIPQICIRSKFSLQLSSVRNPGLGRAGLNFSAPVVDERRRS